MSIFFKKSKKILGINERNLKYLCYSPSKKKRIEQKLETKKLLKKFKLPFPKTLAVIKSFKELVDFDFRNLPNSFVLKPNKGFGGSGIIIVFGKKTTKEGDIYWIKSNKERIDVNWIKNHVIHILEGQFSMDGHPDIAVFEERIQLAKFLKPYSYSGIPDIRIIVYNSVPIMAMLRLPTKISEGRANLHLGGIGVGIDLASGKTTSGVLNNKIIYYLPNTKYSLRGIQIPDWKKILEFAVKAQMVSKIRYIGIDIAIDREKGPLILELNNRPGLSIQLANLAPLKERMERIEGLEIQEAKRGVIIAQQLFGSEFKEEFIEEISGKKIIGINEPIKIFDSKNNIFKTIAKIDTGAYRSVICSSIAEKLNLKPFKFKKVKSSLGSQKRPIIKLSFILDEKTITTEAFIVDRSKLKYDVLIGRKDLKGFFVDPRKNIPMIKILTLKRKGETIGKIIYKLKGTVFYVLKIGLDDEKISKENYFALLKHFIKKLKKEKNKKIFIKIDKNDFDKKEILKNLGFVLKKEDEEIAQYQKIIK